MRKLHDFIIMVWLGFFLFVIEIFEYFVKMDEDQWMYDSVMSKVDMKDQNEDKVGVNEEHVDYSDAFNTS